MPLPVRGSGVFAKKEAERGCFAGRGCGTEDSAFDLEICFRFHWPRLAQRAVCSELTEERKLISLYNYSHGAGQAGSSGHRAFTDGQRRSIRVTGAPEDRVPVQDLRSPTKDYSHVV